MDDRQQLMAWGRGDRAAGEAIVVRHYDAIVRFFMTQAGAAAADLVQPTFLDCAEAAARYEGRNTPRAFLYGIARNVLYEHIRSKIRFGHEPPDFRQSGLMDLNPGAATLAAQRAEHRALVTALQTIPLESQVLLELYYWEELSIRELAHTLGVAEGTIKSRLHRAREMLRGAVDAVVTQPEDQRSVRILIGGWLNDVRDARPENPPC